MKHAFILAAAAASILGNGLAHAHQPPGPSLVARNLAPDASKPASVVDAFHAALRAGDTAGALAQLSEDAIIFESGGVERGKADYASHHAPADAAFAQAVPSRTTRRAGQVVGGLAWVLTEGRTTGTYKGKPVDRVTTETMLLRRAEGMWRIVHIHWSSAAAKR